MKKTFYVKQNLLMPHSGKMTRCWVAILRLSKWRFATLVFEHFDQPSEACLFPKWSRVRPLLFSKIVKGLTLVFDHFVKVSEPCQIKLLSFKGVFQKKCFNLYLKRFWLSRVMNLDKLQNCPGSWTLTKTLSRVWPLTNNVKNKVRGVVKNLFMLGVATLILTQMWAPQHLVIFPECGIRV